MKLLVGCELKTIIFAIMANKIMTTQQYADDIYKHYSKSNTASQQRIRKMIKDGKKLPQVVRIMQSGKYHLLEVTL